MPSIPLWIYALVLAAATPWCVSALAAHLERRRLARTRELLRNVGPSVERSDASIQCTDRHDADP